MGVHCARGGPWVVSPASALAWGFARSCSCSCSWSPPEGDRAHSEVGSKVHENCRLWAFLPAPRPTACDARFRFRCRTRRASFRFLFFSCFPGFRLAKRRAYLPRSDCGELGNRGPGRRNGKKQGILRF